MKSNLIGIIIGLVIGAAAMWFVLRRHEESPAHDAKTAEASAPKEEAKSEDGLILTKKQQANAGLTIASAEPAEWQPTVKGFGRVLDPAPLVSLLGDIESARAALEASTKEHERLKMLREHGENASARALESAEATMIRDRTALLTARASLVSNWGKTLAERSDLAALTQSLLTRDAALARVDFLAGEPLPSEPYQLSVASLVGHEAPHQAQLLGRAPSADPQVQGTAFLVLLSASAPPPGATLSALLTGSEKPAEGLRLPRSAIVFNEGEAYVYLQTGTDEKKGEMAFDRRRVELGPPLRDGVLVTNGLTLQDKVVVKGAQSLLSVELKSAGGEE